MLRNLIGLSAFLHFNFRGGGGLIVKNQGPLEVAESILQVAQAGGR